MTDRTGQMIERVTSSSIRRAVERAGVDGVPSARQARTAFVIDDKAGRAFPAKYIFGLAHEIETGEAVPPDHYSSEPRLWAKLEAAGLRFKRTRPSRATVVTVVVEGVTAQTIDENVAREDLLVKARDELLERDWGPSVLLFPGGFFHLPTHVGPLPFEGRRRLIETQAFSALAIEVASTLGCVVVAGVDGEAWMRPGIDSWEERDYADQMCVAWDASGLTGIGRKIFPTTASGVDTGEAAGYVSYAADFVAERRVAALDDNASALLCACYDMFGCTERPGEQGKRSSQVRWLGNEAGGLDHRPDDRKAFKAELTSLLGGWRSLVEDATVGLAAIHHFSKAGPGSGINYWERHGIQVASQVVGGRLTFGAYHREELPSPEAFVMAAANGRPLPVADHLLLDGSGHPSALLRRFDVWL